MKNLVVCIALLLLAGCATMTQHAMSGILDSWQGEPVAKVIDTWGQPTQKFAGIDTTMYQWTDSQRAVPWKLTPETQRNTETPGASLVHGSCTRQLIVNNASGTVQSGTFHGDNCCVAAASGYCKSLKNPAKG